jgi:hypothetical protein
MCLKFGFVIFWLKDFGAKAAHKMLVKLTPGDTKWQKSFNYSKCIIVPLQKRQQ